MQRIEYLSDEILMEKRLGIAQLCLLLAVLVFMALTRGSQGPVFEDRRRWRPTLRNLSKDWSRSQTQVNLKRNGDHKEPQKILSATGSVGAADSGSSISLLGSTDKPARTSRRVLPEAGSNPVPQRMKRDENLPPEQGQQNSVFLVPGTPPRTRPRTLSRSHSRTLSSSSRGFLSQPGTPSTRMSGTNLEYGTIVASTPSKGSRTAGIYYPGRPVVLGTRRNNTYIPLHRQPPTLQRAHSSHGSSGTAEYVLGGAWTGSGNVPKSARKWARTAHLHVVKAKQDRKSVV